jgi:hypothetical protein
VATVAFGEDAEAAEARWQAMLAGMDKDADGKISKAVRVTMASWCHHAASVQPAKDGSRCAIARSTRHGG